MDADETDQAAAITSSQALTHLGGRADDGLANRFESMRASNLVAAPDLSPGQSVLRIYELPAPFGGWRLIGDRQLSERNGPMAVLRLTPANLVFMKRSLRKAYPDVKSSHLTEALAAAVGSKTHAALIIRLEAQEVVARIDALRWQNRLYELGNTVRSDNLTAVIEDPDLPDRCWIEVKRGDRQGINDWFYACRAVDVPNVIISPGRKYARLEWDCISTSGRGDKGIRGDNARALGRWLFNNFQHRAKNDPGRPVFEGSSFTGRIERLSPDTAKVLADDYFLALTAAIAEAASLKAA